MSSTQNIEQISAELNIPAGRVLSVIKLISEDATVPFIARYRKEVTGGLDEIAIISIRDRHQQLEDLDKRREAILKSLKERNELTPELEKQVKDAKTLSNLEDIYLPYRPKKRTRATIAREKGLEPLAELIFDQNNMDLDKEAGKFISAEKEVTTTEEALQGARDIIAEWINENKEAREKMRLLFEKKAQLTSKVLSGKESEAAKYRDYFEWSEPASGAPSHRMLAIRRAAQEGLLLFHILPEEEDAVALLEKQFVKGTRGASEQVKMAVADAYKRLLSPSMEVEMRLLYKKKADAAAIHVFTENIRELLLASPLGQKSILALDPGLRTGCKLVCLDQQGALIHTDTIYPLPPRNQKDASAEKIRTLCRQHHIEAIAVGNGTGGRETLAFCKELNLENIIVMMVNESGASVYSASEAAREEFPDYDLTVRGAVSIGRRLMDPLAELVKIDPKSIGVGQYQHDVDQKLLKTALDDVVMSCVNAVGVEVNTASSQLLSYTSGISRKVADNIIKYRNENGPFRARADFQKISGMGPKSFEQAAGFLRIRDAENPLDASAVHPESYPIVEKMAKDVSADVTALVTKSALREKIDIQKYVTDTVGIPTLEDILNELEKPGRDPRKEFEIFSFSDSVNEMKDLSVGMRLPGVVTNVAAFGAFVDIGVHQDGLVHISQLADRFVKDPHKVVKVNQKVMVTILEVDMDRKRISLSMKENPEKGATGRFSKSAPGKKKTTEKSKKPSPKNQIPENSPFAALADLLKK